MRKKESVEKIGALEIAKHTIDQKLREFADLRAFCAFAPYVSLCLTRLRAFVLYVPSHLTRLTYVHYLRTLRALFSYIIYTPLNVTKSPIKGSFKMFYEEI